MFKQSAHQRIKIAISPLGRIQPSSPSKSEDEIRIPGVHTFVSGVEQPEPRNMLSIAFSSPGGLSVNHGVTRDRVNRKGLVNRARHASSFQQK